MTLLKRLSRLWLVLATGVLILSLVPLTGHTASPGVAGSDDASLRALVVLDVSGSMEESAGPAGSRLEAAKQALSRLVYALPRSSQVGLRVYGAEKGSGPKDVTCRDTQLLVPVAKLSPEVIVGAAAGLRPTGDTPIAYSLQESAKDFPGGGTKKDVVILVSDGEDNCSARPPCDVVRDLRAKGMDVRVESVGVQLAAGSAAQRQLQCIAQVTGGQYHDAQDGDALTAALAEIANQSLGRLGDGDAIGSSSDRRNPVTIEPGAYLTEISRAGELWYQFEAPPGVIPRVSATIQGVEGFADDREGRCQSWRAEMRNRIGEGHLYPPYGSSSTFSGTGFGTAGAATSQPLRKRTDGIDYSGRWFLRLSLGRDAENEILDCTEFLPKGPFRVRLSLTYADPITGEAKSGESPSRSPKPKPTQTVPEAAETADVAAKYNNPAEPAKGGLGVVGPLLVVLALGGLGAIIYRVRQRRQRGW